MDATVQLHVDHHMVIGICIARAFNILLNYISYGRVVGMIQMVSYVLKFSTVDQYLTLNAWVTVCCRKEAWGADILAITVLGILLTAPLGAVAISFCGPKLLQKN